MEDKRDSEERLASANEKKSKGSARKVGKADANATKAADAAADAAAAAGGGVAAGAGDGAGVAGEPAAGGKEASANGAGAGADAAAAADASGADAAVAGIKGAGKGDDSKKTEDATGEDGTAPAEGAESATASAIEGDAGGAGLGTDGSSFSFNPDTSGFDKAASFVDPIGLDETGAGKPSSSLFEYSVMEGFMGDDGDYASLPEPEVFNAYPPEVQRKIMEWTDRDVKARRDDESRRQDALMRARVDQTRRSQTFPVIITVLAILCGAVTGIITGNPLFPLVFLIIPIVVVVGHIVTDDGTRDKSGRRRDLPPWK